MKISDFEKMQKVGKTQLSEWVMKNEHYPDVDIYFDNEKKEYYQISKKHHLYRKTDPVESDYDVKQYSAWKKIEG
ncbi:MAG: hypothetical protein IPM57_05530 [Oligoflexia bacterium]|nr:hypothetical protein [Oligoflexia bacterium]